MARQTVKNSRYSYQRTANAYSYPAVQPRVHTGTTTRVRTKKVRTRKRKPKAVVYKKSNEGLASVSVYTAITIIMVFVGSIVITNSFAKVALANQTISQLETSLAEVQSEESQAKAEIADNTDLDKVKQIAMNDLGMVEPQPYQIVHINVPAESYVVQNEPKSEQTESFMEKLKNFINGIFNGGE